MNKLALALWMLRSQMGFGLEIAAASVSLALLARLSTLAFRSVGGRGSEPATGAVASTAK